MWVYLLIFFVVYMALILAGWRLMTAVARRDRPRDAILDRAYRENDYDPYQAERELNWVEQQQPEAVSIHPVRAPRLSAYEIPAPGHRWVLLLHDYGTDARYTGSYARWFHEKGHRLLLIDGRGCGRSEGKYLGLGGADRYDLEEWIRYVRQRDGEAEIVLFGLGSGGSAALLCAVDGAPVKGVIADSAYAGLQEAVMAHLMARLGAMTKVIANFADAEYAVLNGMKNSWKRADLWRQIQRCTIPLLLIHGEEDYFFPVRHFEVLTEKVTAPLQTLRVAGAGHIACAHRDPEGYWQAVETYLDSLN